MAASEDPTCDPSLSSWVPGADGCERPVQALPFGVFSGPGGADPRVGVAIGPYVLDLAGAARQGLLRRSLPCAEEVFCAPRLNDFMALGRPAWRAARQRLSALLQARSPAASRHRRVVESLLVEEASVTLHRPVEVADFADFYASEHHAARVGALLRPGADPLPANWRHLPAGYHGRSGSVVVSGTPVARPRGQMRAPGGAVVVGPTAKLDFELEVGFVVGVGSRLGQPVAGGAADEHVFGVALVNDWSARDIQAWESAPLGPFLGKSFATSMSAWVLPLDALASVRVPGPPQDPPPAGHLAVPGSWGLDLEVEARLRPAGAEEEAVLARVPFRLVYWTFAQQLAHLTSNGAPLRTGDLFASGTVSGPGDDQRGCLLEATAGGARPLDLPGGVTRTFLEDGDEVVLRGRARYQGVTVGLGEVRGTVAPA